MRKGKSNKKVRFYQAASNISVQQEQKMDLPYPTMKKTNIGQQLSHLDKLGRSILLSTRQIPKQDALPKTIKSRIQKIIISDNPQKLCSFLETQVIRFDTQIGSVGSGWNILHYCAKNDAHKCIEYVLKTQYQEFQEEYKSLLNSKTIQDFTPIIIAIINRSNKALQKMLTCGGVDIHVIDQNKMTPCQIAFNYRNDHAIKLLMNYHEKTKKKQFVNQQFLRETVVFPKKSIFFRQKCASYFLCCISLGFYDPSLMDDGQYQGHQYSLSKNNCIQKGSSYANTLTDRLRGSDHIVDDTHETIDYVPIGSQKNLTGYDIEWKRAVELMESRITLFQSYNPFDTQQKNFTIKNNLIIFQSLANISWLLRKLIKIDKKKQKYYEVCLYPQNCCEKVSIDDYIPFIKDRNQAMFLSNTKQLWPMLIQKALAKIHTGYFSLINLPPMQIIQQLTGFPTFQQDLSLLNGKQVYDLLHELTSKQFLFCFKGKSKSKLVQKSNQQQIGVVGECFNILNFYEKNDENLVLVNCPFVSDYWKKKEKDEPLALKLIKGHYNTHNQMCVWIPAQKLKDYFSSLLICNTFTNYQRTELKITTKRNIFIKFRVEKIFDSLNGDKIYMRLIKGKDQFQNLKKMEILKDQGIQRISIEEDNMVKNRLLSPSLEQLVLYKPGEYFAYLQLEEEVMKETNNSLKNLEEKLQRQQMSAESIKRASFRKSQELAKTVAFDQFILLTYSPLQPLQPQYIQQQFGILQWFGFLKNQFKCKKPQHSDRSLQQQDQFCIKTIGQFSLIMLKQKQDCEVFLRYKIFSDDIIQGRKVDDERVQLLGQQNVFYCVLRCNIKEDQVTFDII